MRVDGEDELAAGALLEPLERLADLIERIDALDDDAKFTGAGKLRETPQLVLCGRRIVVGIATLYRRFPTREDLIPACFETRVAEYATAAEEALEAPDAWSGFCAYVERICAMQAADRGLKGVLTRTFPNAKTLERHRSRGYELSVQLIDRAKTEGSLRPDFAPEDLVLLLMANAGVVEAAGRDAPDAWRRFVGLMLEAFRADRAGPLPPAPSPHQMIRAMRRLGSS